MLNSAQMINCLQKKFSSLNVDQRDTPTKDQYGNQVPAGQPFLTCRYLERGRHSNIYSRSKRTLDFYKESLVYLFVQAQKTKKGFLVSDIEFCKILKCVESNNLSSFLNYFVIN